MGGELLMLSGAPSAPSGTLLCSLRLRRLYVVQVEENDETTLEHGRGVILGSK